MSLFGPSMPSELYPKPHPRLLASLTLSVWTVTFLSHRTLLSTRPVFGLLPPSWLVFPQNRSQKLTSLSILAARAWPCDSDAASDKCLDGTWIQEWLQVSGMAQNPLSAARRCEHLAPRGRGCICSEVPGASWRCSGVARVSPGAGLRAIRALFQVAESRKPVLWTSLQFL